jgi:hypothetical protein
VFLDELTAQIEPADICASEGKLSLLNLFPDLIDAETSWKLGKREHTPPHLSLLMSLLPPQC